MILREVNGQRFNSIIEFSKFIAEKKQGEEITLEVETKKGIMNKKLKIGGFLSKPPLDYEAKKHLASFIAKKEETHRAIVTHIDLLGRNIQIEIDDLAITIERRIFSDPLPKLGDIVTVWIKSEKQCVLYFQKDNKMERVEFWILRGL